MKSPCWQVAELGFKHRWEPGAELSAAYSAATGSTAAGLGVLYLVFWANGS